MKGTNVNLVKSQEPWKQKTCYMGSLVRDKIIHTRRIPLCYKKIHVVE